MNIKKKTNDNKKTKKIKKIWLIEKINTCQYYKKIPFKYYASMIIFDNKANIEKEWE
jgi:hypothetical protein